MNEYLSFFLKTIGLEENEIQKVIDNPDLKPVEEQVKNSVLFILEKKSLDEVEEKITNINLFVTMQKLENQGAVKTFDDTIIDNRYDFSNMLLKKEGILLRTRETSDKQMITLKKRVDTKKSLCSKDKEHETEIDDIDVIVTCLKGLGIKLVKGKRYVKHRISYVKDGVHFDFDKYDGLDWLLEIESDNEETVQQWKTKLGLLDYKTVKYGYRKLKEEERKKNKRRKKEK